MLSFVTESDFDGDGLGDATEDPDGGNPAPPSPVDPAPPGGGTPPGGGDGGGDGGGGSGDGDGDDRPAGPRVTIDGRGLLAEGPAGDRGWVKVYLANDGTEELNGTLQLKLGRQRLKAVKVDELERDEEETYSFRLPAAERRRILRGRAVKGTVVARLRGERRTLTPSRRVTFVRGGDARYDGTYRGPGPVTIVVERGVVVNVSTSLMLFCSKSNRSMTRTYGRPYGVFPTLVRRDGSFSEKGSVGWDTFRANGRLKRSGPSKGYLSIFHTEVTFGSDGRISSETCYQAKNWTVRRAR